MEPSTEYNHNCTKYSSLMYKGIRLFKSLCIFLRPLARDAHTRVCYSRRQNALGFWKAGREPGRRDVQARSNGSRFPAPKSLPPPPGPPPSAPAAASSYRVCCRIFLPPPPPPPFVIKLTSQKPGQTSQPMGARVIYSSELKVQSLPSNSGQRIP